MRKKTKRITILDVAKASGVTDGTVSRALSGDPRVQAETRERIIAVAQKLNYHPHLSARLLRQQESGNLGIFWQGGSWLFYNHYYGSLVSGLAEAAEKDNLHLVFYLPEMQPTEDPNPDHQKVRITGTRELLDGRVDGAVVLSVRAIPEEELSVLRKASLPVVLLSVHRKVPGFSQVLSGTYERTRLAAEKLLDLGHRKIGFLGYYVDSLQDEVAKEALQDLFRERGLKLPEDWMEASDHWNLWDVARIERQLDKFLDKKFTAVICVSADQASLGIEILRKKRIQVPRDLSLVAFGPLSFVAQFQKPALCLLEADIRGAGAKAYELFKQAKEGQEPQSLCIDWKWAENGESAGPPPK